MQKVRVKGISRSIEGAKLVFRHLEIMRIIAKHPPPKKLQPPVSLDIQGKLMRLGMTGPPKHTFEKTNLRRCLPGCLG